MEQTSRRGMLERSWADTGPSGLCDLHLRIDGPAQGGYGRAWDCGELFSATWTWFQFDAQTLYRTLFDSYAFDSSVWEIWGALLQVATGGDSDRMICGGPEEFNGLMCEK